MNAEKRKRGRPRLTDSHTHRTDNRIVFKSEPLIFEDSLVGTFDGKLQPETKTLKIYKYNGDITKFEEAIQDYAIVNHIDTVITSII